MQFEWRRLQPGELDHELIWLCVTVGAAVTGLAWVAFHLPWPSCTFRALTGLPCVTCGATRSTVAFLSGDFGTAWRLNPLVFAGLCGVIFFNLYAIGVIGLRARRVRLWLPQGGGRMIVIAVGAAIGLLNWIYLLQQF